MDKELIAKIGDPKLASKGLKASGLTKTSLGWIDMQRFGLAKSLGYVNVYNDSVGFTHKGVRLGTYKILRYLYREINNID